MNPRFFKPEEKHEIARNTLKGAGIGMTMWLLFATRYTSRELVFTPDNKGKYFIYKPAIFAPAPLATRYNALTLALWSGFCASWWGISKATHVLHKEDKQAEKTAAKP